MKRVEEGTILFVSWCGRAASDDLAESICDAPVVGLAARVVTFANEPILLNGS